MRTYAFVRIPNSPLQHPSPAKRHKLLFIASVVLGAHIVLLTGLLIQGGTRANRGFVSEATSSNTGLGLPTANSSPAVSPVENPPLAASAPSTPVAAPLSTPSAAPAQTVASKVEPAPEFTLYTVKSGDSLSRIAKNHHTTIKLLSSANNLTSDRLRVGQKLRVPAPNH
jgi:LysM repeat protein